MAASYSARDRPRVIALTDSQPLAPARRTRTDARDVLAIYPWRSNVFRSTWPRQLSPSSRNLRSISTATGRPRRQQRQRLDMGGMRKHVHYTGRQQLESMLAHEQADI